MEMKDQKISFEERANVTEYSAPWPTLIQFETDLQRHARIRQEDPFLAAPKLRELLARGDEGDAASAYTLYSFAEFCEERGPWAVIPSFEQRDETAPKNWSAEQRQNWMRTAARGGYWIAGFAALKAADRLEITDERRPLLIKDAIEGLEIAAHRGSLEALQSLASEYESGEHVAKDLARAYAFFQVVAAAAPEGNSYWAMRAEKIRQMLSETDLRSVRLFQQDLAASVLETGPGA